MLTLITSTEPEPPYAIVRPPSKDYLAWLDEMKNPKSKGD